MINNIGSSGGSSPISLSRAERAEKVDKALDSHRVSVAQMSSEQLAANRSYGHQMVDDIQSARMLQPASGQSSEEFSALQARLTAGV
tara:strand:+ start:336 stop:596 length:261 start_codon:yes stop_codon:yes gene_type:complete